MWHGMSFYIFFFHLFRYGVAPPHEKHVEFGGRILMVGFGSIGQGTLPLIIKHVGMDASKITVLTGADMYVLFFIMCVYNFFLFCLKSKSFPLFFKGVAILGVACIHILTVTAENPYCFLSPSPIYSLDK